MLKNNEVKEVNTFDPITAEEAEQVVAFMSGDVLPEDDEKDWLFVFSSNNFLPHRHVIINSLKTDMPGQTQDNAALVGFISGVHAGLKLAEIRSRKALKNLNSLDTAASN